MILWAAHARKLPRPVCAGSSHGLLSKDAAPSFFIGRKIVKITALVLWSVVSILNSSRVSAETTWEWMTLFPRERVVPLFSANPTAPQFSAGQTFENRNVSASMGALFPMIDLQWDGFKAQLSVGSSVYAYLNPPEKVNLISTDFYIDFIVIDIPLSNEWALRIAPGHTSHHLSDNAYAQSGLSKPVDYVRDYWEVFGIYRSARLKGFVYGGALYAYTHLIDKETYKPWMLEIGGEFLQTPVIENIVGYAAVDLKFRQEAKFSTTQNYQIGLRFVNSAGFSLRLAYNHRAGVDERGQFIPRHVRWNMLAVYLDV
jgi:hypothetical protein